MCGTDQPLRGAVIAECSAQGLDTARHGGIGYDPPVPYFLDDLLARQHPFTVLDQQQQQRELLGLERHDSISGPHFQRVGIERVSFEVIDHRRRS